MRGQITVKSAVPKESVRDLTKGLPGPHCTTSLDKKIAQLRDFFRVADGHICKLQRLQHAKANPFLTASKTGHSRIDTESRLDVARTTTRRG
jgi:hypothetical protein